MSDANGDQRALVQSLVARSGLPVSSGELDALVSAAGPVQDAVRRLYAMSMDHETEPAVTLTYPAPPAR